MQMVDRCGTSKPEDKIFRVLGLVAAPSITNRALLEADCTKSVQDIYRDATRYAIYREKDLYLLNQVRRRSDTGPTGKSMGPGYFDSTDRLTGRSMEGIVKGEWMKRYEESGEEDDAWWIY